MCAALACMPRHHMSELWQVSPVSWTLVCCKVSPRFLYVCPCVVSHWRTRTFKPTQHPPRSAGVGCVQEQSRAWAPLAGRSATAWQPCPGHGTSGWGDSTLP